MVTIMATSVAAQPKPGCQSHCGNISIPYPFGTRNGCYISSDFFINCDTSFNPPKAFLSDSVLEVLNISLDDGSLRIRYDSSIGYNCYNSSGRTSDPNIGFLIKIFPVSHTRNKFTAIGCDTIAYIDGLSAADSSHRNFKEKNFSTGCLTFCGDEGDVINGSCSGIGCCQTAIPKGLGAYYFRFHSSRNHSTVLTFNPCSYGFLVENGTYTFSPSDLSNTNFSKRKYPLILDWTIGNQNCKQAKMDPKDYACKQNSACINPESGPGYLCKCNDGFQGNPYLSNGCQDIDECETLKPCNKFGTCHNTPGSYNCSCPHGFKGDGRKNGTGCHRTFKPRNSKRFRIVAVALGSHISIKCSLLSLYFRQEGVFFFNPGLIFIILFGASFVQPHVGLSLGILFLIVGVWWLYKILQRRKYIKLKQKLFERNGGLLFQRKMSSNEGGLDKAKLFSSKELEIATDKYNENRILCCGGQGMVYKGMLFDGRIVAVKKPKTVNEGYLEQFINEIFILSQIDHRNIVKLLGCCLETEVPLLVYEFIPNGTLSHLIHDQNEEYPRSWDIRLRIAAEVANAISYLHSSASIPIYHRDIKSSNILLDEKFRAKVSDFGTSRSVGIDQTHLTTKVLGTFGYLDPEYFQSSHFTEKSDVYSFRVVIVELLTGKEAILTFGSQEKRGLVSYFMSSMEENHWLDIVDVEIGKDGQKDEVVAVAELAKRCLNLDGRYRPTMKEVAMELERFRTRQGDCIPIDHPKQAEVVVRKSAERWDFNSFSTEHSTNCSITSTSESESGGLPLMLEST
ncbi:wall-associated receptor kinase 2-like [Gossypium arboreum]|uniref:wall-associated receptor kinase 2-like n=1 Tax=Gossypium arboreum TaxID=29729 RepID=UPI0022F16DDA|nr:wall-associated receptor kinase 2-like [Gossypium arboreum]